MLWLRSGNLADVHACSMQASASVKLTRRRLRTMVGSGRAPGCEQTQASRQAPQDSAQGRWARRKSQADREAFHTLDARRRSHASVDEGEMAYVGNASFWPQKVAATRMAASTSSASVKPTALLQRVHTPNS